MSASLNLIPNPAIIAVQTGIFLASLLVVKKCFVSPYLSIRAIRQRETQGAKDNAKLLLEKNEKMNAEIESQMRKNIEQAELIVSSAKASAMQTFKTQVDAAEKQMKETLDRAREDINKHLAVENEKLPNASRQLAEVFFSKLIKQ